MSRVEDFYNRHAAEEWGRLERHRTEFAVTLRALEMHLPSPPGRILDVGGGPGRYSIALAKLGYEVILADLSSSAMELAAVKAAEAGVSLAATIYADARDLEGIADSDFDGVLLMGPLYHLLSREDRLAAACEAGRVVKPGGQVFAAFVTRFAPFRTAAVEDPAWLIENSDYAEEMYAGGVHDRGLKFPNAYFAHPEEIEPLMREAGFSTLMLLGCEGIVAGHEDKINQLRGESWERWVDFNFRLGQEPSLFGAADHLLYVGMKPAA